jgi:hypothetical protein
MHNVLGGTFAAVNPKHTFTMKFNKSYLVAALAAVVLLASCKKDEDDDTTPTPDPVPTGNIVVSSNISSNTTWTAGNVYQLGGRITVLDGATLTIEAGVIVKGEAGTGSNATALLVARGGRLNANGTAALPIIFTSVADEITPAQLQTGNFVSPNLDPNINGLWGGVIVLGRAPISASSEEGDETEVQIDGIPTSDPNGLYGGNNAADNSGSIRYISIRHGGANIGLGNEINGLTLGGVGSATVVDHVEVVANQDDGIEWFGGTVNTSNAVVWNAGDDGIDTDQSWAGTLDNFVVITPSDHCFELDGPEGSLVDGHTIRNGSVKASSAEVTSSDLFNLDDNCVVNLENIYFTDIAEGQVINRVVFDVGDVNFSNIQLNVTPANLADYINGDVPAGISAGTTPQADISVFGWTWTSQAGAMSGL